MAEVIYLFDEDVDEPPMVCHLCGDTRVVEEREPFIWGEKIVRVRPCPKCAGGADMDRA